MAARQTSATWFSALRRDGRLFVLAATLILLGHALQPLAMANAAAGGTAICSVSDDAPNGIPLGGTADECPTCTGGTCAAFATPQRLVADSDPAFASSSSSGPILTRTDIAPTSLGDPPPAIRAPPSFA